MHAALIMLPFLLSCGPEECKDLEFFVDLVLDDEEELYQSTYKEYRKCEGECDGAFLECMELAGIVVEDNNKAPVADPGGDQLLELQQTCWLDGSGSTDPDDDVLLPTWVILTKPDGSELKNTDIEDRTQLVANFAPDVSGLWKIKLTVDDGKLESSKTVEITVVNEAPTGVSVATDPDPAVVGGPVEVTATVVDPDNDPDASEVPTFDQEFTYAWTLGSVPEGSTVDKLSKDDEAKTSFTPDLSGTYTLKLTVSDGELEASGSFDIDVVSGFAAPEDPTTDTGFVPPTEEECVAAYDSCEGPCVHPDELDYPYTKRESPIVSWTGDGLTVLSIVIAKGPKKDDVVWSVKCPKEDNCLTSPVVYGEIPPGAELNKKACKDEKCDTDQRNLLTDGQVYKASGARDEGGKYPCTAKEENEVQFEHPNRSVYSYD